MARLELGELVPHARMPDRLVFGYEWPVYVGVKEVGGRSCVYGLIKQESKLYSGGRPLGRGQHVTRLFTIITEITYYEGMSTFDFTI